MLISWKWLQNLVETGDLSAEEAARKLTARGLEVEGMTLDPTCIRDIKVARMVRIVDHPNSDHLHLVDADVGEAELVRVVCGAPGIQEGWLVPFAPIGAQIGDFKIKKSKLRGEESFGMLCSEVELGLGSDNETLLRLSDDAVPGTPLIDALGLDVPAGVANYHADIFEIGLTPDRGDCLSHYGVARELAAALGTTMKTIDAEDLSAVPKADFVSIENSDDCPRYMGIQIENVVVGPSPAWLRRAVEAGGARSINNVVDVTNWICFELGHPMHAFDADKLAEKRIAVRRAKAGEKILAINHETYDLCENDVVITDGTNPVAVAAVMGGADTEVSESTTSLIFEIASFHPTCVRKTSKRLGLHSESSHRFERFVDANGVLLAARRAVKLLAMSQKTPIQIVAIDDKYIAENKAVELTLRPARVKEILGVDFDGAALERLLKPIGFVTDNWNSDAIRVKVPTWRSDITREIDIIEEVCRGYGFDNFPANLPDVAMKCPHTLRAEDINPTPYPVSAPIWDRRERARLHALRESLIDMGLDECMHYTFMDPADPARINVPDEAPMKLANPMSVEHSTMRTCLLPSMLNALNKNMSNQQKCCTLFEIGEIFESVTKDNGIVCLDETQRLAILFWGEAAKPWYTTARAYDIYDLKGCLEAALHALEIDFTIEQGNDLRPWLHDGIQANIVCADGTVLGSFGELHPIVLRNYKIDSPVFYAELDIEPILKHNPGLLRMKPLARFHFSTRDQSMLVSTSVTFKDIAAIVESVRPAELESWQLFDVYRGKQIEAGLQSISLSFRYRHPQAHDAENGRPLSDDEVNKAHAVIVNALNEKLGGTIR